MAHTDRLPDYAPMLADYHRAYAKELGAMVDALPIRPGDRVLELACGDGAYARRLADRAGPTGALTAVDFSPAFLGLARDASAGAPRPVGFAGAEADRLPFADDTFDLVWCAQSLYSLPEPVRVVAAMRRVVNPGGVVAVLENDTLHHVLLPWPVEVELAVRAAELSGLVEKQEHPSKFYVGRRLREVFREAGLGDVRQRTYVNDRQAPLDPAERGFLGAYLADLWERTRDRLAPAFRARFDRIADPSSGEYLLDRPDLTVTCLDHVVTGRKPGA